MNFYAAHPNDSIRVWLCFHYVETFLAPAEYLRYCDLCGFLWYSMWRILFNLVRL